MKGKKIPLEKRVKTKFREWTGRPDKHQKAIFIVDGKKYSVYGAMTVDGNWAFRDSVISKDQSQVMINLDGWKK